MNPDIQARLERFKSTPIDGQVLKKLVEAGLTWLRVNQQTVNSLNVFPVPDGDTGTNMVLTMQSAYNEIDNLGHHGVGQMAAAVSQGALMGARKFRGDPFPVVARFCTRASQPGDPGRPEPGASFCRGVTRLIKASSGRWKGPF